MLLPKRRAAETGRTNQSKPDRCGGTRHHLSLHNQRRQRHRLTDSGRTLPRWQRPGAVRRVAERTQPVRVERGCGRRLDHRPAQGHTHLDRAGRCRTGGRRNQSERTLGVCHSVTNGRAGAVSVVDAATHRVLGSIPVGRRPWGLVLTRDDRTLFTANGLSNSVSVIDTPSNRVVATIPVGNRPWGVALVD